MALNGYRSRQDKASRLVKARDTLVTVVRVMPQRYEVYNDGKKLGEVFRLRSRWDWAGDGLNRIWRDMHDTRQAALDELVAAAKRATAGPAVPPQQAG